MRADTLLVPLSRFSVHKNMGYLSLTAEISDLKDLTGDRRIETITVVGNYAELTFRFSKSLYSDPVGEGELHGWEWRLTPESQKIYEMLRKNAPELVLTLWND